MMDHPIRVVVCDDHPVVREGILRVLARMPDLEVVGTASDGEAAVELAGEGADVVLMDLSMPSMDGILATERIKSLYPEVQVLVVTSFESEADVLGAIKAGASGYLLKDAPPEDLFRAIRMTVAGQSPLSPAVAARLMGRIRQPVDASLNPRETEALQLAAQGATNKEIADHFWVSVETVKDYLQSTYAKLGASGRVNAVAIAVERGLIRLNPPPK